MSGSTSELDSHEVYQVHAAVPVSVAESQRRKDIASVLRNQFLKWRRSEHSLWSTLNSRYDLALSYGHRTRLTHSLGNIVLEPNTRRHILGFLRLPDYGSSEPATETAQQDFEDWWQSEIGRYVVHITQYGTSGTSGISGTSDRKLYCIPLLEVVAKANIAKSELEECSAEQIATRLPKQSTLMHVQFPQTRCSFLTDESFFGLYPFLVQDTKKLVGRLLRRFQSGPGLYNSLAPSFFEEYSSAGGFGIEATVTSYPYVAFEDLEDYTNRKQSERLAPYIQNLQAQDLPSVSQFRYARRFDLSSEVKAAVDVAQLDNGPAAIQSSRGLYEYRFPEFETLQLDDKQAVVLQQQMGRSPHRPQLLVIDSLWLVGFPSRGILLSFRNRPEQDVCSSTHGSTSKSRLDSMGFNELVAEQFENVDRAMWAYEPLYRKRLSWLQYCVRTNPFDEKLNLVQSLSDVVAELQILLDILQRQIELISKWSVAPLTSPFDKILQKREDHKHLLTLLSAQAKETQDLFFQISSTETARRQALLALEMSAETKTQVNLTKKAEQRNKSILVFTIITVIFLPLSFFTSYFGMNTSDIRNMSADQRLYWKVAGPFSLLIVITVLVVAFGSTFRRFFTSGAAPADRTLAGTEPTSPDLEALKKAGKLS